MISPYSPSLFGRHPVDSPAGPVGNPPQRSRHALFAAGWFDTYHRTSKTDRQIQCGRSGYPRVPTVYQGGRARH